MKLSPNVKTALVLPWLLLLVVFLMMLFITPIALATTYHAAVYLLGYFVVVPITSGLIYLMTILVNWAVE